MSGKRKPSRVAAEAIRELSSGIDKQTVTLEDQTLTLDQHTRVLEEIKKLLVDLTDGLSEHRQHTINAVDDLGKRVKMLETRLR